MPNINRTIIQYSVEEVIRFLENEPVKPDLVPQVMIAQLMNRAAQAHLSIERALKFLTLESGGPLIEIHDLCNLLRELGKHDPNTVSFLEDSFQTAVRHYRYNPNRRKMGHLKTLETYLKATGSEKDFQGIRYWELSQSLVGDLHRQIYLTIHTELLHALREALLPPGNSTETVDDRVERIVQEALYDSAQQGYHPNPPMDHPIKSFIGWTRKYSSWKEALSDAVKDGFELGSDVLSGVVRNAYETLLESKDPAASYFVRTLNVLPRQPRDAVPNVEWLGPEKELYGKVTTPGGTTLGFVRRGPDGLWSINPIPQRASGELEIANTQTDARCYLANTMTKIAQVTVDCQERPLRLVGDERNTVRWARGNTGAQYEHKANLLTQTHRVVFWDDNHGVERGEKVRIKVRRSNQHALTYTLEGEVLEVEGHEISVSGHYVLGTS